MNKHESHVLESVFQLIPFTSVGHLGLSSEKGTKEKKLQARVNIIWIKNELLICIMISEELNPQLFVTETVKISESGPEQDWT